MSAACHKFGVFEKVYDWRAYGTTRSVLHSRHKTRRAAEQSMEKMGSRLFLHVRRLTPAERGLPK